MDPQPGGLVVKPGTRKRGGDHPGGCAVSWAAGAAIHPCFPATRWDGLPKLGQDDSTKMAGSISKLKSSPVRPTREAVGEPGQLGEIQGFGAS
jgi:hypothetical protein